MLNGLAPLIIYKFPVAGSGTFGAKIPIIGKFFSQVGVPIPIYLDEKLTGIYVDSESKAVELDVTTDQTPDGQTLVSQKGVDSIVTINFVAKKDSIILAAFLAFNDLIFQQAISTAYSITYINGATLIFDGLLRSFTSSQGIDDDLIRITMTISKANMKPPTPKPAQAQVDPDRGTLPGLGGA